MKKTLFFILFILCAAGTFAQGYSVRGTINAGNDGKSIYLATYKGGKWTKTDSAKIEGNKFVFNGNVESPQIIYLLYYNGDKEIYSDFVLENSIIAVNAVVGDALETTVMGTEANNGYNRYKEILTAYREEVAPIRKQLEDPNLDRTKLDSLRSAMYACGDKIDEEIMKIMDENATNFLGLMFLQNYYSGWEVAKTKAFLAKVPAELQTNEIYKKISSHITVLEKTAEGQPFADIVAKTPEGKDIKLSDYVGKSKLVLVDFWASWCGPCMMEMPNVVKAYEEYKSKGLEIVGVSLDNKAENWQKALVEQKMTWPQMSDLKAWKCEGAATYGVRAIPATVLIGEDGKIVARNLRGGELLSKIAEILK